MKKSAKEIFDDISMKTTTVLTAAMLALNVFLIAEIINTFEYGDYVVIDQNEEEILHKFESWQETDGKIKIHTECCNQDIWTTKENSRQYNFVPGDKAYDAKCPELSK